MTQNRVSTVESRVCNVNPDKWRANEARIMFSLLHGEYENSKRLNPPQRYKELKRIISMFTSGPVLEKMRWLSEEDQDDREEIDCYNETATCKKDLDIGNIGDQSGNRKDSLVFSPNFSEEIRRFVSKMKILSSFPNLNASPSTSSFPYDLSDVSSYTSYSSHDTESSCGMAINTTNITTNDSNNKSVPTTPVSTSKSPEMPSCSSWPLFKKIVSDPLDSCSTTRPNENETINITSTVSLRRQRIGSSSSNEIDTKSKEYSTCHRRSDVDMCIIKKDQIPDFEIPPLRIPNSKTDTVAMIVPSLYVMSNPNSPTSEKMFTKFRTSSSSPNIHRSEALDSDQQSIASSKGFLNKFRQAIRRDSKSQHSFDFDSSSEDLDSSCNAFDIQEAHSSLTKMKQEYEGLSSWNIFSRYRKMKKMLKSCGTSGL